MDDHIRLMDEPFTQEIPRSEYIGMALLMMVLSVCIGGITFLMVPWLEQGFWLKTLMLLDWSVFGLALLFIIDALPQPHKH